MIGREREMRAKREECLSEENEEYCFHRLGEIRLQPSKGTDESGLDNDLHFHELAIASRHGWTVLADRTGKPAGFHDL